MAMEFTVVASGVLGLIIFRVIEFFSLPMIDHITQPVVVIRDSSQGGVPGAGSTFPLETAFINMRPKERVNHTMAGTNASPMNSFIVKLSSAPHIRFQPATKRNVNKGENMAYTQSLMARTRSIAIRAIVKRPNIMNIIAAITL